MLRIGVGVFTAAFLLGSLGGNAEMLIASRGLQDIGAAMAAPNVLALIATNFPVGNRAMAVYGAMSALGITVGVLLDGILVGLLSWRWVFFINIAIGLAVLAGTEILVEGRRNTGRLDTLGAVTGMAAVVALPHGYTTAFLAGAWMLLEAVVVIVAVNTRRTQGAAGAGAIV